MLTDAVAEELAAMDEAARRIRADLQTLARWGKPFDLPVKWRVRLGLDEELENSGAAWTFTNETDMPLTNVFISASSDDRRHFLTAAQRGEVNADEESRLDGLNKAMLAREVSAAIVQDVIAHQEERSSIDYAVRVLSSRPGATLEVGEIIKSMRSIGWRTQAKDVRNVVIAVLGQAAEKYGPLMDRPGRGQYRWLGPAPFAEERAEPAMDLRVPQFLLDGPSGSEEATGEARS